MEVISETREALATPIEQRVQAPQSTGWDFDAAKLIGKKQALLEQYAYITNSGCGAYIKNGGVKVRISTINNNKLVQCVLEILRMELSVVNEELKAMGVQLKPIKQAESRALEEYDEQFLSAQKALKSRWNASIRRS